jgi:hypothetical protein
LSSGPYSSNCMPSVKVSRFMLIILLSAETIVLC